MSDTKDTFMYHILKIIYHPCRKRFFEVIPPTLYSLVCSWRSILMTMFVWNQKTMSIRCISCYCDTIGTSKHWPYASYPLCAEGPVSSISIICRKAASVMLLLLLFKPYWHKRLLKVLLLLWRCYDKPPKTWWWRHKDNAVWNNKLLLLLHLLLGLLVWNSIHVLSSYHTVDRKS